MIEWSAVGYSFLVFETSSCVLPHQSSEVDLKFDESDQTFSDHDLQVAIHDLKFDEPGLQSADAGLKFSDSALDGLLSFINVSTHERYAQ